MALHLEPKIFNLQSFDSSVAAMSTTSCKLEGGEFLVGGTTSEQSRVVASLAEVLGACAILQPRYLCISRPRRTHERTHSDAARVVHS